MPRLSLALSIAWTVAAAGCTAGSPPGASASPGRGTTTGYYLSLGDSLSVGDQPDADGVTRPTSQGYADQLHAMLGRDGRRELSLVKLGCPGETTATMLDGGICGYAGDRRTSLGGAAGSQLAAATAFLRTHRGHVPLVTIDIGANDLNGCVTLGSVSVVAACARPVIVTVRQNTARILTRLRAADPGATIAGMTYYIPELAAWLSGQRGRRFAAGSIKITESLNAALTAGFAGAHSPVADVFAAFHSADMTGRVTLPGFGRVPENVALICRLTWACAAPPSGPNEHANAAGYRVIARAFAAALPARVSGARRRASAP